VGRLGSGAIVIALPFACILGFLAAIVASNFGKLNNPHAIEEVFFLSVDVPLF
jgi:hypothetical protein